MIEYVSDYILWAFVGILFFLILVFLIIVFFKRKSAQHRRELYPRQGYTKTISDASRDSHLRTSENTINDLKCYTANLTSLLEALTDEIQGVRESLNQIAEILQSQVPSQSQDISSPSEKDEKAPNPDQDMDEYPRYPESGPNEGISPVLVEFCDLYNAGEGYELQTRYQEHHRLSVVNAMGRRQDLNQPLLFEKQANGKFLVYYIEEENLYAVVPSYDLVLERLLYDSGAFGEVFDCSGFDPRHSYSVKLILPARFEPDYTKEKWTLEETGQLELTVMS